MNSYLLRNGNKIPVVGYGTWEITPNDKAEVMVASALKAGYRHIDTAKIYGNEQGVGKAIRESGIARSDIFVTTKLWDDAQSYEAAIAACEESMKNLGLDYIDLYLIHWPKTSGRHDAWKAFEELQADGKARSIGVSNYTIDHLQELMDQGGEMPAVNQVEFHPFIYQQQKPLLDFCHEHDIVLEAYSPLSRLSTTDSPEINEIADKYEKSQQQIVLRWCIEQGTLPLPRSTSHGHIGDNLEIFDFELSKEDMSILNGISDGKRITWDPAGMGNE
jgi:diketogulonate reductase-like aldo/keto reductase